MFNKRLQSSLRVPHKRPVIISDHLLPQATSYLMRPVIINSYLRPPILSDKPASTEVFPVAGEKRPEIRLCSQAIKRPAICYKHGAKAA